MYKQSNDLYDIMSSWNSFYSEEPCAVVDQPVRQEESLQRAKLSKAYKKAYQREYIMAHSFSYINGEITVTGVLDVKEFGSTEILAALEGESLSIKGSEFKIISVDLKEGRLIATGKVSSMQYGGGLTGGSFLRRLFK